MVSSIKYISDGGFKYHKHPVFPIKNYYMRMILMITNNMPISNQTIYATAMECAVSPLSDAFMTCNFIKDHGITAEINNVAFDHVDVVKPKLDVHRDKSTGDTVIAVQSDGTVACDVMGEPARGVTVRCRK
jgi:hypothetical protein